MSLDGAPAPTVRRLAIIWWSMTGGSRALAQAAYDAARAESAVAVIYLNASQVRAEDLLAADAYLFVMPEMLGGLAGQMKDLFDRCYYPMLGRLEGRGYGVIICAGSDGTGALRQLERILTGWRLRRVSEALIVCTHAQTPEAIAAPKRIGPADLQAAATMGEGLAAGLGLGIW